MKTAFVRFICHILIVSLTSLSIATADAGMVSAEQIVATASTDRDVVMNFLSRDEVASALQARGVEPQLARERVASMTDAEIAELKGKIDTLPAGAFMTSSDGVLMGFALFAIVALIVLIVRGIMDAFRK